MIVGWSVGDGRRIVGDGRQIISKNRFVIVGSSVVLGKKINCDLRIKGSVWQKNRNVIVGSLVEFSKKTEKLSLDHR